MRNKSVAGHIAENGSCHIAEQTHWRKKLKMSHCRKLFLTELSQWRIFWAQSHRRKHVNILWRGTIRGQGGEYPQADFPSSKSPSLKPFSDHPIGGFEEKNYFTPSLTQKNCSISTFPGNFFKKNSGNVKEIAHFCPIFSSFF